MVVTRSEKKKVNRYNERSSFSYLEKTFGIKECYVRIERLTSQKILEMIGKPDGIEPQLPNVVIGKRQQPKRAATQPKRAVTQPKTVKNDAVKTLIRRKSDSMIRANTKKEKDRIPIQIGQFVLARQKHSVPWPSKVLSIGPKYADVHFYGDGRHGPVKREEISLISKSKDVILNCLRRNIPNYLKGIIELERVTNVPDNLSITKLI